MTVHDTATWTPQVVVNKFNPDTIAELTEQLGRVPDGADLAYLQEHEGLTPDEVAQEIGNLLTTVGLNRITNLIIGGGGAAFTNAQGIIGVGSTSTAAAVGDTALGGNGSTSTAYYQGLDAGYPTQSNGLLTAYATFGPTVANFAWNEWCLAIATGALTPGGTLASVGTNPVMLNHKAPAGLGTKASGSSWQIQATITIV
ncbi:hypothetical protein [Williamsia deligens]|uniref:Uncharacterized protein n=1 Tax=Williamsia deligens TaxID=321325 RepID=A0ABW3GH35_9NOCA|nr:hypothetical protein [Williamsia deligens]MCP2196324.1 hypothetical protein [Williamsia deligens]